MSYSTKGGARRKNRYSSKRIGGNLGRNKIARIAVSKRLSTNKKRDTSAQKKVQAHFNVPKRRKSKKGHNTIF